MPRNGVSLMGFLFRKNEMYNLDRSDLPSDVNRSLVTTPHRKKSALTGEREKMGQESVVVAAGKPM